jgi:hypothetical protein
MLLWKGKSCIKNCDADPQDSKTAHVKLAKAEGSHDSNNPAYREKSHLEGDEVSSRGLTEAVNP